MKTSQNQTTPATLGIRARNYLAFLFTCLAFASGFASCLVMMLGCYAGQLGADSVAWNWMGYSFVGIAALFIFGFAAMAVDPETLW